MQDARYFRSQAELCLEIAKQMSDLKAAENLGASAATYLARAVELETQPPVNVRSDGPREQA